jgi:hypothetical protein
MSGQCWYVYTRHGGARAGHVCGRPEGDHCTETANDCQRNDSHPHHPFHRRAAKRCGCGQPIEPYYDRCRACYKAADEPGRRRVVRRPK